MFPISYPLPMVNEHPLGRVVEMGTTRLLGSGATMRVAVKVKATCDWQDGISNRKVDNMLPNFK